MPPNATSSAPPAACTAVVGLQWGDEGKGKVVDLIAPGFDAVVRFNGGANAGHSVVVAGERYALHLIPSGILYPGKLAVIANGVVVDPEALAKETDGLISRGVDVSGLVISDRAHVVMPYHKAEDELRERFIAEHIGTGGSPGESLGTTRRGIGPCYADKAHRATAVRMADLVRPELLRRKLQMICAIKKATLGAGVPSSAIDAPALAEWGVKLGGRFRPSIKDTTYLLHDLLASGKRLLFEGANAALLDVDHGTHPFVTSSSTTALGIPAGTGIPGTHLQQVIGVVKAYSSRVGNGPMPTELIDDTGHRIRERGREYGTTTGRPRRVGWLDLVAVKYSAMLSGATGLALTLLDVLSGLNELRICTAYRPVGQPGAKPTSRFTPDAESLRQVEPVYQVLPGFPEDISAIRKREKLPARAREYVDFVEQYVGVPICFIGVGPERTQTIVHPD